MTTRRGHLRLTACGLAVAVLATACTEDDPVVQTPQVPMSPTSVPAPVDDATMPEPTASNEIVMWGTGGLPDDVPVRARALPAVTGVRTLHSDTIGMVAVQRGSYGIPSPHERQPDGFQIPVSVTAIDPVEWTGLYAALAPGEAIVTRDFWDTHLDAGDEERPAIDARDATISLVGLPDLAVAEPDDAWDAVGRAEVVIHVDDAAAVGIDRGPTIIIDHDTSPGEERAALVEQLLALSDGHPSRVVDSDDPALRDAAPLVLSLAEVKARFGTFAYRLRDGTRDIVIEDAWVEEHIVIERVPILGRVRCHRDIFPDLRAALGAIEAAGLASTIRPEQYAGCYHPRRISATGASLSRHSWGIAIDVNVDLALPGGGTPLPDEVIAAFGQHGFRWGGDFIVPDNHHFEWVGGEVERQPPSP